MHKLKFAGLAVLSAAMDEVFDVPSVRQLLQARAVIRKTYLSDAQGAADDLKRLHELAPGDEGILRQLEALYAELGDYRGLVQLYENQILRGRDPNARAELARRVALIWRDKLKDARETADAWRRVLRMKPGDNEAKEGIALAKRAMPFRRTPAPAQGGRRRSSSPAAAPGTGSERPGPSYPPSSQVMDHGGYALDDDEEVRDEDLALDDEVEAAYDGAGGDGTRGGGEDLDVDVEVDEDDDEELDPVTTVDERGMLNYAEAAGPGLRLRPPGMGAGASGSQPSKRKRPRKRARTAADTGVHRKPNVSRRSKKH